MAHHNGTITPREADIRAAHAADEVWTDPERRSIAEPCVIVRDWGTVCRTHGNNFAAADRDNGTILCDLGLHWNFIVHVPNDEEPPQFMSLEGVYRELRGWAQNEAYDSTDSAEPAAIHRYLLNGSCQRDLTFVNRSLGDNKVEVYLGAADPEDFEDPENWPEPSTYAKDGTTYLRFTFELE